jgi:hypothetical protein
MKYLFLMLIATTAQANTLCTTRGNFVQCNDGSQYNTYNTNNPNVRIMQQTLPSDEEHYRNLEDIKRRSRSRSFEYGLSYEYGAGE